MFRLKVIYNSASPANIYSIVRRLSDGYVHDGSAFVEWEDADIADYDIPLNFVGGDLYVADFPEVDAGDYLITYSLRSGSTPATTDTHVKAPETIYWNGVDAETPPPTAVGYYADINNLYGRFGEYNINAYSNVDNDTDGADLNKIQASLDWTDTYINRALQLQGYQTPIPKTSRDFSMLTEIATVLAACRLHDARIPVMSNSVDAPENAGSRQIFFARRDAEKRLTTFALGRLDATRNSPSTPIHPVGI